MVNHIHDTMALLIISLIFGNITWAIVSITLCYSVRNNYKVFWPNENVEISLGFLVASSYRNDINAIFILTFFVMSSELIYVLVGITALILGVVLGIYLQKLKTKSNKSVWEEREQQLKHSLAATNEKVLAVAEENSRYRKKRSN